MLLRLNPIHKEELATTCDNDDEQQQKQNKDIY